MSRRLGWRRLLARSNLLQGELMVDTEVVLRVDFAINLHVIFQLRWDRYRTER